MKWFALLLMSGFTISRQINADEIVKVNAPKVILRSGKKSVINVAVVVKSGYHIQADEASNEFMIPTTLEVTGDKMVIVKEQFFPAPKKFRMNGTDEYLDVYDGRFEIGVCFEAQSGIRRGVHQLDGKLNYQACDSIRCLFPRTVEFSIDVEVR